MGDRSVDRDGFYALRKAEQPSSTQKYIDGYDLTGAEIQNLEQHGYSVVKVITLDLSVAQPTSNPVVINFQGRAFTLQGFPSSAIYDPAANTGVEPHEASAFVNVFINHQTPDMAYPLHSGGGFRGTFNKLFLTWPAQGNIKAKFICFLYSATPWDKHQDTRFTGRVEGTIPTSQNAVTVTSTAAQLLPQLLNRKVTEISNLDSTNPIYVGGTTVANSSGGAGTPIGIKIAAGQTLFWRNTGALWAVCDAGQTALVSILDET